MNDTKTVYDEKESYTMSSEVKEITVKIKGDDTTVKQKFLVYDPVDVSCHDDIIKDCIKQTKENFNGEVDSIKISILLVVI